MKLTLPHPSCLSHPSNPSRMSSARIFPSRSMVSLAIRTIRSWSAFLSIPRIFICSNFPEAPMICTGMVLLLRRQQQVSVCRIIRSDDEIGLAHHWMLLIHSRPDIDYLTVCGGDSFLPSRSAIWPFLEKSTDSP